MHKSKDSPGTDSSVQSKDTSQPDEAAYRNDVENQAGHDDNGPDTAILEKAPKDPNIVDWDGPHDSANPMNWPPAKKFTTIGIVSLITLLS